MTACKEVAYMPVKEKRTKFIVEIDIMPKCSVIGEKDRRDMCKELRMIGWCFAGQLADLIERG